MVGLPSLSSGPASVRRPFASLAPGDAAVWRAAIVRLRQETALAPAVGCVVVDAVARELDAVPAVEDPCDITLGYDDGEEATVCTGTVAAVEYRLDGRVRLRVVDDAWRLARTRIARSWEKQGVADIIGDLASEAGVDIATISGPTLPFLAIDQDESALRAVVRLAAVAGAWVHADPAGGLVLAAPEAGQVIQTFEAGVDILAVRVRQQSSATGALAVLGAGAAGSGGADAWPWIAREAPRREEGDGQPQRRLTSGSWRSQEAVDGVAAYQVARAGLATLRAALVVPGAPQVIVGGTVATTGADADQLNGEWLVVGLQHKYDAGRGFTTHLDLVSAGGGGLGGLL